MRQRMERLSGNHGGGFLHSSLQPVSRIIESELSAKLESPISLSFRSLMASDLAGRARAFGSLTTNEDKLTAAQAGRVCGFDLGEIQKV